MNLPADAPFVSRPAPKLAAGAMALGVHVLFALLLVFGVSWQTQQPAPVMVDLWEALPKPVPSVVPPPKPRPEPAKAHEPVKAAPLPKPVVKEPPPVKAPDIALEKKKAEAERLNKLQATRQAEEKARAKAAREKQLAEQEKRELLRQMEEEDLMRSMADEATASAARQVKLAEAQAKLAEARAAASKRQTEVERIAKQNSDLISAKVQGNTRLPDNLKSNIEVRFQVKLLPTGEVVGVHRMKSSDNLAFDEAVARAIQKSSPLPLPADRDARAKFVPEFTLIQSP